MTKIICPICGAVIDCAIVQNGEIYWCCACGYVGDEIEEEVHND